ncbi:DMT family transporter [Sneathiella limimaris]|uniref:DMT family transporter n=1 Tax=Sneathiella limimaris TaxID=1964213 RepID=UPI0019D318C3|nr:DMT family transporter [Sneathiella limimaris]
MSTLQPVLDDKHTNLRGSFWMIVAMAAFAVEDALIKAVAVSLPVAEVLVLFGIGGMIFFAALATWRKEPLFIRDSISPPMRVRVCFEVLGRLFYVLALAFSSLSATTAILQATPIVVVLGAAVFFKEKVGWRRWTAIGIGLVGVLVILRPATDSFTVQSILAVLGMLGFAGRDLASRAAPKSLSSSALGFYGFIAIILAGALYSLWEQKAFLLPDLTDSGYLCLAVIWGAGAYTCLMKAMRTGEVSIVTPFRYTRLLFGIALGVILFNETVDTPMIIGCTIIVLSGLFILARGNRSG